MRRVVRVPEPESLRLHKAEWTKDLLDALELKKMDDTPVPDAIWNRYNKPDVREALGRMFDDLCGYCESKVKDVAHEHIEHRKPKVIFPKLTFEWANLHLACPKCNLKKSNRWDEEHPILDPTEPGAPGVHLLFEVPTAASEGVARTACSKRGETTIRHTDLNRDPLCEARLDVYLHTTELAHKLHKKRKHPNGELARERAFMKFQTSHGSLIRWVLVDLFEMSEPSQEQSA